MPPTAIDWNGARVADGTLGVGLTEPPPKGWTRSFQRVVAILNRTSGDWGQIELRRGTITVHAVREGSEDKLRHLLDSVIVEISGDLDAGAAPGAHDVQGDRDLRMTEAFRRFRAGTA